jgi:hypothetical protein
MKKIIKLLAPLYLGFALSAFAKLSYSDWEFYAIIVPFFLLVAITKFNKLR